MRSFKISLALFCFILLAIFWPSRAQNSPKDFLDVHNAARREVGVDPIVWNDTLAAYAERYAYQRINYCDLVHSRGPYGENLAVGSGNFTARDAVNLWVNERPYYDYKSNSCIEGKECRHYTQVVWRRSIFLGCYRVRCRNGWWFVICVYYYPGNYFGQFPY